LNPEKKQMHKVLAALTLFLAAATVASGAPTESVDFRRDPAFLAIGGLPERLVRTRAIAECPGRKEYEEAREEQNRALAERSAVEQEIGPAARKRIQAPTGTLDYSKAWQAEMAKDPRHVAVSARIDALVARQTAEWKRQSECDARLRATVYGEIEFRSAPGTGSVLGHARFTFERGEIRGTSTPEWRPLEGEHTYGGESSTLVTVLEKKGDWVLLPKGLFPVPAWFDWAKAARDGMARDSFDFVFPRGGETGSRSFYRYPDASGEWLLPERIDGNIAVFRRRVGDPPGDGELDADSDSAVRRTLEKGKTLRMPLGELRDPDGKLKLAPTGGC
jgi:hypothetical protein